MRRRAAGEIILKQRDDSPYWYLLWYDPKAGRERWTSTRTTSYAEAEKIRARRVLGITEQPVQPSDPAPRPAQAIPSLGEVLDSYLSEKKDLPSREQNEIAARHLKRIFGKDLAITELQDEDKQQDYVDRRFAVERRSANTVARELNVLRAALYLAFEDHPLIPRFRIGYFSEDDLPVCDRHLSHEEAAKLIANAKTRHARLYMRFALSTGGRPEAVLDARWSQIRF